MRWRRRAGRCASERWRAGGNGWRSIGCASRRWSPNRPVRFRRGRRLGMNLGALAAILLLPVAAPWLAWITTNGKNGPSSPLLAGMLLATLAVLARRPTHL